MSESLKYFSLFILAFVAFNLNTNAQKSENLNPSEYISEIQKERDQKDLEMLTDEKSPIKDEEKTTFTKLKYYEPDIKYQVEASFKRFDQATHFLMKTTTERLPEYSIYGIVNFDLNGETYSLNVYQNIELVKKPGYEKHLFIPFNDETNGEETYGGGRFLDLTETGEDTLVVDFNLAYNPYCAYNHKYSCPIPPEENNLKVNIEAGEKKWNQ